MEIYKVRCPKCGEEFKLKFEGNKCTCKSCGNEFNVGVPAIGY